MEIKEKYNLEFKESISKTFLKTVSAYANYNDGKIIFGITDDGKIIGMGDIKEESLKIENMINDSIAPVPQFQLDVEKRNDREIIILTVKKGKDTPYYYNHRAYKRSDTSSLEVDRFELRRLALKGINMNFEETQASTQNLEFNILESKLKEVLGIEKITPDILKTLDLLNKKGDYNFAAELLSDENDIKFSGIDVVQFGENINQIRYRETIDKVSLLTQYDKAIEIFGRYYQYEEIEGYKRIKKELVPREAFREALANAIVHRIWDINSYIQISMFKERIEINSPGGLPEGISADEYLYRNISLLRNPIIAGVFYRLNVIERFGTGIMRINEEYADSIAKPSFTISENYIKIILPVVDLEMLGLSEDENRALDIFKAERELSRLELENKAGFNKSKAIRVLNSLIDKNMIKKLGNGSRLSYRLK
ncbi:MAG: RNA-binding domain-containing protein [Sphaerochaetaceae bacterium]